MFKEIKTSLDNCENSFRLNLNNKKDKFKFQNVQRARDKNFVVLAYKS